ncbi:type I glutamate--ammonia ligase [Psittacicella melopsittaci]|uniref:Type I glutamate--ammonia ligase n=1 Tax=Psittacicella melopsittaci TaxID=2028576 RepID=A0A3A1Y5P4_9GAMM|nr:type I glutamate--ammonia ligase [Psittacicella melopsittaci]RIY33583.1 type I glutamate--ammonia ligase [Psittacicella melopsittaci]
MSLDAKASAKKFRDFIEAAGVVWADLRFTDILGKEQHVSIPASLVDEDFFLHGKVIDGSSIKGWKSIDNSDMVLLPVEQEPLLDLAGDTGSPTIIIRTQVYETSGQGYDRCPRTIAVRAEEYLRKEGFADQVFVGPELEFFLFDSVRFENSMRTSFYEVEDVECIWNSNKKEVGGTANYAHRPGVKGGYFPVAPIDHSQAIRSLMCEVLAQMGLEVEAHHHEVAMAQNEIATRYNTLVAKADEVQVYKYVVHNVAHANGKTATFMPKPLYGDNGSGMHVHFSLTKDGENLFVGDEYAGLSETALYFIGGVLKHARALNAFTNPSTNSYKRLVPGFEAPVMLAYSASNRSASVRIPAVATPKAKRIEVRFPDCTANPYLAFSALLMAGLDGIKNKIHPGAASDRNLYDLEGEELLNFPQVAFSLEEALKALAEDHAFLLEGGVFTKEFIDTFIALKARDVQKLRMLPHPIEFELYYSC